MSLTKIHSFTAWVNVRLSLQNDKRLNNVLIDLFQDDHWQRLIESFTGAPFDKIGTFTGLSQAQKTLRFEWIVQELKSWNIIAEDININYKLLAARNSEEVFSFLFKLVSYDVQFLWKRMDYFQLNDAKILSLYEFKMNPEKPVTAKARKFKVKKDLLAGFGTAAETYEEIFDESNKGIEKKVIFKHEMEILSYKECQATNSSSIPKTTSCVLQMINSHFKMSNAKKIIKIDKLTELCDVNILYGFFNILLPNSFSKSIIPNDRFSINLILKSLERVLRINSDFDATDLNSKDNMSLTVYFTLLFLMIFPFHQILKVLEYKNDLQFKIRFHTFSIEIDSSVTEGVISSNNAVVNKKHLMEAINDLDDLKERFDIEFCELWRNHQRNTLNKMFKDLREAIDTIYEITTSSRTTNIGELCNRNFINTRSMKSSGYYQVKNREVIPEERDIILFNLQTKKIISDVSKTSKSKVRSILKLQQVGSVEIDTQNITKYEVYVDTQSKNKPIFTNENYLYKLFPGSKYHWKNLLLEASKNNDICTIKILLKLFSDDSEFINWQEPESSNSALHLAAFHGLFEVCLFLLESGANVNIKNRFKNTPIIVASEEGYENVCGLLLEWGAEINVMNARNLTVLDTCKTSNLKSYIESKYKLYSESQQLITDGNNELLCHLIHDHRTKKDPIFLSLRSRCILGSTLLHTAAYFSNVTAVKELLMLHVDVNLQDYKGASALHRATDLEIIDLLLECEADITLRDHDGNLALHAACYGVEGHESQIDKIKILINHNDDLTTRNNQSLMPIHCAAMQGRSDVIELLLDYDKKNSIMDSIFTEGNSEIPPSICHLALSCGFVQCATWILDHGFLFKENEANELLKQLITGNIVIRGHSLQCAIDLLILRGKADINRRFPPLSQTTLHFAAGLYDSSEMLDILIKAGADIDATDAEHCTPLFVACKLNNIQSAKILIENDANINVKNNIGKTPFDFIPDYIEWINCGSFNGNTVARLKAYNLKQARNTIRTIDKKINFSLDKDNSFQLRQLESRLDQNLVDDLVERSKSQLHLRPRSTAY